MSDLKYIHLQGFGTSRFNSNNVTKVSRRKKQQKTRHTDTSPLTRRFRGWGGVGEEGRLWLVTFWESRCWINIWSIINVYTGTWWATVRRPHVYTGTWWATVRRPHVYTGSWWATVRRPHVYTGTWWATVRRPHVNTGTWWATVRRPHQLYYRPAVFFRRYFLFFHRRKK